LEIRSRVGILHEKPRFPPRSTGREYLQFSASLRGVEEAASEIERTARRAGISSALDRKISGYSAGMVQRLGLACATMGSPELIILDEPTANLDPRGRSEVLSWVRQLWSQEGVHVIFSTHLLSEIERTCDSIIILDAGKLIASGRMEDIRARSSASTRIRVVLDRPEAFVRVWSADPSLSRLMEEADGSILIVASDERAALARINEVARRADLEILSLTSDRGSLERLFLDATTEQDDQRSRGA
jgi:ABC-type multidrug transport system ATPase subunit